MTTITREFTKEQLIKKAQEQIEFCRHTKITGEGRAHVNQCAALFEIALAALTTEPVVVIVPPIWKHYSNSKVAETYERAMDDAGVQWRDEEPEETELRETVEDAQRNEESF